MKSIEPVIAILTDFGYRDHYAGVLEGVIAGIAPRARVITLTHGVAPQSITAGALALAQSWRFFPRHTVFLAVVDPGVGTERLPIAIETRAGARMVGPDNGLLALAAGQAGLRRAVELKLSRYRRAEVSSTFHGRDIFAPAAAWLARGTPLRAFGPALPRITPLMLPEARLTRARARGEVIYVDGFGNLITNIGAATIARLRACFPEKALSVRIGSSAAVEIFRAYGDARVGRPLATIGSFDLLEIAVRDGSAAQRFRAKVGATVVVNAAQPRN